MAEKRPPQWQPLSMLPVIAPHIDGMLEATNEQYNTLQQARSKPHVLDDYTIGRVIEVFTTQQNDLWLFDEQLTRWKKETLTTEQRKEVERLTGQMKRLHEVIGAILALANELKERTIEKVMAKSDVELGLEALFNALKNESWPD